MSGFTPTRMHHFMSERYQWGHSSVIFRQSYVLSSYQASNIRTSTVHRHRSPPPRLGPAVAVPFHLDQNANSVHFVIVVAKTQFTLMLAFGCAKSTDAERHAYRPLDTRDLMLSNSMSSASLAWMSAARPLRARLMASLEELYIMRGCDVLVHLLLQGRV
jgi:hypothetical protein